MLISVVTTTKNEEKNIRVLLDSLVAQDGPHEVIVVDSASSDRTPQIVREYEARYPGIVRLVEKPGKRPYSMDQGVQVAKGDAVAFIGGDDRAAPGWIAGLRRALRVHDVVAGRIEDEGNPKFAALDRVELTFRGFDVSFPGTNTAYRTEAYRAVGGLDPWFVTAEDIDLNLRVVMQGYKIGHTEDAVVYRRAREGLKPFFMQAFWNGYGRKQLTLKHGRLWSKYSIPAIARTQMTSAFGLLRLFSAGLGYLYCYIRNDRNGRRSGRVP
ncbi:MAG: glycosyltransferase [Methanobacteriota archaeon]